MPNSYRTTDKIVAQQLEDGKDKTLSLSNMRLLASGAFSNVYSGTVVDESNTPKNIVIKKTWPRSKNCPMEVKILGILGKLKHKNVIQLLYSYQKPHGSLICLSLIFEFVPSNLHQFMKDQDRCLDIVEVKLITWQMFRGQAHLQRMHITHRDIKPQNLLYDPGTGVLKVSDFGSSTLEPQRKSQSAYHVTRYYRPPELILGSKYYGPEIDVWSCGCVFGEMLKGGILLAGRTSTSQGDAIFDMIGLPTKDEVMAMKVDKNQYASIIGKYTPDSSKSTFKMTFLYEQKPEYQKDRKSRVNNDKIELGEMKQSVDLLRQILVYTPTRRLSGTDFLMNHYFDDLFDDKTIRYNNQKIDCIDRRDRMRVRKGDTTITHDVTTGESVIR